jgi:calcineurin-like phosphoesterase family protein
MIWFTADHHFFSSNIIKYCNRPFKTAKEMNETMIRRWNERVAHTDVVFILGDFCFASRGWQRNIMGRLNGHKIMIRGNHDKSKVNDFPVVLESALMYIAGQRVVLSHYPYGVEIVEGMREDRFLDRRPPEKGLWLIHGHCHEKWKIKVDTKEINVGVDVWDFYPVSKRTLEGIILKGEAKYAETKKV